MKLQTNLPQNADGINFFERYASLINSLTGVAFIAQLITGFCEVGILYTLLYPSFADVVPPQYLNFVSMCGACICAAMLQMGLKEVFPYSIRAILYNRFKGLDLAFTIGIFILTISILAGSIALSWQGSKDIAEFAVSKPIEKTTSKSDSTKNADFATAQRLFTSDSANIEMKYKGKSEALTAEFNSRIRSADDKASQTAATAPSWSKSLRAQAAALRGEMATKLATLQADKATELQAKAEKRQTDIDKATNRADSQADVILSDNKAAKDAAKVKANSYSGYIGYFTLFCYVFFLFTYILNEIYHKGAKIDLTPIPSQRHFNPSVFAEWIETAKEKLDVHLRTKIQNWADKTPPQPLPLSISALYDFKADVLTDTVKIETTGKETKVVKLPLKVHKIAAIAKDETTKKADETPSKVRVIGFKKQDDTADDITQKADDPLVHNESRPMVKSSDFGKCENCGNDFFRNHKIQRFCGENCRKNAWKNKTGKNFDLSVKNKERRKK
jgi:hypothetical protein